MRWPRVPTLREKKAIRVSTTTCLNLDLWKYRNLRHQPQSSRASITLTRRRYGRWDSPGRPSLLPVPILAFAGPTTRLNLTTAVGTAWSPTTTTTGTTPFMTASATLAAMIHRSLVMISFTALTPQVTRLATTALATRSGWPPAQNGLAAVTWTLATAHRPDISSAWSSSWRLTP